MSTSPAPGLAELAAEIARMQAMAAQARARLAALNQEVADAEARLGDLQSMQLVEANERLVLAALDSQSAADTAAQALDDAFRRSGIDDLTGLPGRAVLLDHLSLAIPNAKRRGARLAVLFLDLNGFKQINDTLGHAVGDSVLMAAASRLALSVREGDTVSRFGGDEFVVLLAEVVQASDATRVADKLISALAAPLRLDAHELQLTASIGISLYPDDGHDASTLLDRADSAMYRAKRLGLSSVVIHGEGGVSDPSRPRSLASLQRLPTHVELALAEQERLNEMLREANGQLVLAALRASRAGSPTSS